MKNEQIVYGDVPAPAAAAKLIANLNKYPSRLSK
jgi:hypothetical protein